MKRGDSTSSEEEGLGEGLLTPSPIPTGHSRGKGRSHGKARADLLLDNDGDDFYAGGVKTEFSKTTVGPRAGDDLSAGQKRNRGDAVRRRPTGLYKTDVSPGGPSILYRTSSEDDGLADTEVDVGECSEDTCSEESSEVMLQNGVAVDRPRLSDNVGDRAVPSGQVDVPLVPPPGWGGRSDWLQEMVAKEIASSEWAAERGADEEEAVGEYSATLNQVGWLVGCSTFVCGSKCFWRVAHDPEVMSYGSGCRGRGGPGAGHGLSTHPRIPLGRRLLSCFPLRV